MGAYSSRIFRPQFQVLRHENRRRKSQSQGSPRDFAARTFAAPKTCSPRALARRGIAQARHARRTAGRMHGVALRRESAVRPAGPDRRIRRRAAHRQRVVRAGKDPAPRVEGIAIVPALDGRDHPRLARRGRRGMNCKFCGRSFDRKPMQRRLHCDSGCARKAGKKRYLATENGRRLKRASEHRRRKKRASEARLMPRTCARCKTAFTLADTGRLRYCSPWCAEQQQRDRENLRRR